MPTDGSMPASAKRSVYRMLRCWMDSGAAQRLENEELGWRRSRSEDDRIKRSAEDAIAGSIPGRTREHRELFWLAIATGLPSRLGVQPMKRLSK